MKKNILITGATGLVGSHLALQLVKTSSNSIFGLYRSEQSLEAVKKVFLYYRQSSDFDKINWVKYDLCLDEYHIELFKSISEIYHTAALVSFDPKDYDQMHKTNIIATKKLLDIAKENGIEKFGFVSSIASLGRVKGQKEYTESNQWVDSSQNSYYSITKYKSEQLVVSANSETLKTYIINPGVILGPCDWNKSSGTIFRTAKKGLKFYTKGSNGFVDVRDVANGLISILEKGKPAERYIAVGENITFKKLFSSLQEKFGKKAPSIYAPPILTSIGWRIDLLKSKVKGTTPVLTKESARTSHGVNNYNNQKMKQLDGFSFYSMEEAIENAIDFFK